MKKLKLLLLLAGIPFGLFAQDIINHPVTSFEDSTGLLYWNKKLPVYLHLSSKPDKEGTLLKSKVHAKYTNPFYFDTEGINYIRTRYAVDTVTKKSVNPHIEILWEVYADGKSPVSHIAFSGAKKYVLGEKTFFGKGLTVTLNSFE